MPQLLVGILIGLVIGFAVALDHYERAGAQTTAARRAYCLEALGERATVYIAGPNVAIVAWDPAEPGRYVVSEGRCAE